MIFLEKIKVAHIITRLDKGGSAENTLLTVKGLDREIYDVILIRGLSIESNMAANEALAVEESIQEAKAEGVRVIIIPSLVRRIQPFYDLKAFFALIKILLYERPHIVHTHTSKAGILGRWAAFFARVPVIVHTPHGHVFWGYFGRLKTGIFILLEKISALITDRLVVLTEQEKNDHLHFHIAPENKFSEVHSGINLEGFSNLSVEPGAMKKRLGIPKGNIVVGTTGRLTHVKGHGYLIEAAGKILDVRLDTTFVFLGDGELLNELKDMVTKLDIEENVKFLGWRDDVAEVMSVFDVFVLPSLNEGMGRVLVEAMALGKPIVASDVGGIPDLVVNGENGFLVPVGDVGALADAINRLIQKPGMRKKMGRCGKKIAVDYSADAMVQKIDRLYRELAVSCSK